nr:uncharacterized protein LOC109161179 [Ipomoea batatas]
MTRQPRTVVAFVSILLILSVIKPLEVISRLVPPPGPNNPGTNNAVHSTTLGDNNFAVVTSKNGGSKKLLPLPSPWKPVSPPTPTAGANSALVGASSRNG